ncbi:hypothetical protein ABW21_db0207634 [Orbilia brochopaga]|nr:hypothetical protein ABW21_db0207634 [Drechslerella brochopaga]
MMDDVVGLVMVQVVASLGGGGSVTAVSIARPVGASVGLVIAAVIVGQIGKRFGRRIGCVLPEALAGGGVVWLMQTVVLVAAVVTAGYAGASVLFGAFIAGTLVTWWDEHLMSLEDAKPGRVRVSGTTVYQRYYQSAVKSILIPFFFASIGFSVPIKRMFAGHIVWRGIVYSVLMLFAKLITGIWLLAAELPFRAAARSRNLWSPKRTSSSGKGKKVQKSVQLLKVDTTKDRPFNKDTPPPTPPGSPHDQVPDDIAVATAEDAIIPAPPSEEPRISAQEPAKSQEQEKDNKPAISLYPALILGLAMVARGEISFLIASIASANAIFTSPGDADSSSVNDDVFVIVVWAAVICTVVGPLGVGLLVRRVKRLEREKKRGVGERGPLGEWSVNVMNGGTG